MPIFAENMKTMKRFCTLLTLAMSCALSLAAQTETTTSQTETAEGPVLTFEKADHNFGIFDIEHAKQSCYFRFTNTGTENLIITDVYATCNCTVPEYPKYEIKPGQTDSIKVSYDGSTKRPGVFRKVVTVNYNGKAADNSFARVTITGEMAGKKVVEQITQELDAEYGKK